MAVLHTHNAPFKALEMAAVSLTGLHGAPAGLAWGCAAINLWRGPRMSGVIGREDVHLLDIASRITLWSFLSIYALRILTDRVCIPVPGDF